MQLVEVSKTHILNCAFESNDAYISKESKGGKALEIISSEKGVTIEGSLFEDNNARSATPNLHIIMSSNVLIKDTIFLNSVDHVRSSAVTGGFIQIIAESKCQIQNCQF